MRIFDSTGVYMTTEEALETAEALISAVRAVKCNNEFHGDEHGSDTVTLIGMAPSGDAKVIQVTVKEKF